MGLTNSNFNFCFFIFSANFKIVKIYLTKFGEIKKMMNIMDFFLLIKTKANPPHQMSLIEEYAKLL